MSIIIKGMEMPKGCAVCPYCDRNWIKPKCHAKSVKGRYMSQKLFLDSRRQDWCPIVEVPTAEKKGKWIEEDDDIIHGHCSSCGWVSVWQETDVFGMNYCPNCGARMEESDGEI